MKILKKLVEHSVIPIFLLFTILTTNHNFSTANQVADTGRIHKEQTLRIIKHFEGFREYPYKDNDGSIKIGYGFPANGRTSITEREADIVLEEKIDKLAKEINEQAENNNILLDTQHIYTFVSMAYNLGNVDAILSSSTLMNENEINKYIKAKVDGEYVILNGLVERRKEEVHLFNS